MAIDTAQVTKLGAKATVVGSVMGLPTSWQQLPKRGSLCKQLAFNLQRRMVEGYCRGTKQPEHMLTIRHPCHWPRHMASDSQTWLSGSTEPQFPQCAQLYSNILQGVEVQDQTQACKQCVVMLLQE